MPPKFIKLRFSAYAVLVSAAIALTVTGALFCRTRAQDARRHQLESVQSMLERELIPSLEFYQDVILMREFDVLNILMHHGVPRVLYLNKKAEVRFFRDVTTARKCADCALEIRPYSAKVLDAIEMSWETHSPVAIRNSATNDNEVIVPLASKGKPLGMVLLQANDAVLASLPEITFAVSEMSIKSRKYLEAEKARHQAKEEPNLNGSEYRKRVEAVVAASPPRL
jgi:hypothetical protein